MASQDSAHYETCLQHVGYILYGWWLPSTGNDHDDADREVYWRGIISPPTSNRLEKVLTNVILVSGLLTTATYTVISSSLPDPAGGLAGAWSGKAFRACTTASFLCSLLTITLAFAMISVVLAYAEVEKDALLRKWATGYLILVIRTMWLSLGLSFYAIFAAVIFATIGFESTAAAWAILGLSIAVAIVYWIGFAVESGLVSGDAVSRIVIDNTPINPVTV